MEDKNVHPWLRDILDYAQGPRITGATFHAEQKEKVVADQAVELLQQLRFEEQQTAEYARAQDIVNAVMDLHIDEFQDGVIVRFTKVFSNGKSYTYAAVRIIDDIGKRWYVTNTERPRSDMDFESFLAKDGGFFEFTLLVPFVAAA